MKAKIRIMKTRPQVTEEEIRSLMDFDDLLERKAHADQTRRGYRRIRNRFIGAVSLLTLPALVFFFSERMPANKTLPVRVDTTAAVTPGADTLEKESSSQGHRIPPVPEPTHENPPVPLEQRRAPAVADGKVQETPSGPVYEQAEPIEGYPALYAYFDANLVYPQAALKDTVEGVTEVVFVIDTRGKASGITIEKSLGPLFDREVERLLLHMPLWRPASYNGKAVQSKISLPITFSIKKKPNP